MDDNGIGLGLWCLLLLLPKNCRILNITLCLCCQTILFSLSLPLSLSVAFSFRHEKKTRFLRVDFPLVRCSSQSASHRVFSLLIFYERTNARSTGDSKKIILINMNYACPASTIFVYKIIIKLSTSAEASIKTTTTTTSTHTQKNARSERRRRWERENKRRVVLWPSMAVYYYVSALCGSISPSLTRKIHFTHFVCASNWEINLIILFIISQFS